MKYVNYTNEAKYLKLVVLEKVAKLCFDGELEDKKDSIVYDIIPGPQAKYRCCIYKEREIIRERITLASGKRLDPQDIGVVEIVKAACEGCPINRFTVTDNCQRCLTKKCNTKIH